MPQNQKKTSSLFPLLLIFAVLILSLIFANSPQQFKLPWFKVEEVDSKPAGILLPKSFNKAKVPILLYHYVEVVKNKEDYMRASLAISPQNFESQLISLKRSGYTFYFVKDLGNILESESTNKPVIITFDDGYGDFYTDAFPILKRQNAKATVFINSGLMGRPNYMTPDQVIEVINSGLVEIGGHGYSHQKLTTISSESAKEVVNDDIANIKKLYRITPVSFSYPYGAYNNSIERLIKDSGYKYAVTVEKGWLVRNNALLEIPRVRPGLAGGDDLGKFLDSLR